MKAFLGNKLEKNKTSFKLFEEFVPRNWQLISSFLVLLGKRFRYFRRQHGCYYCQIQQVKYYCQGYQNLSNQRSFIRGPRAGIESWSLYTDLYTVCNYCSTNNNKGTNKDSNHKDNCSNHHRRYFMNDIFLNNVYSIVYSA